MGNPAFNLLSRMYTVDDPHFFVAVIVLISIYLVYHMYYKKKYTEAVWGTLNLLLPLCTLIASIPRYEISNIVFVLAVCRELPSLNKCLKLFVVLFVCLVECTLFFDWMQGKVYLI